MWMSGRLLTTPSGDGVRFEYLHGGYLNHGPHYAANSITDPRSGRTICGWLDPRRRPAPESRW